MRRQVVPAPVLELDSSAESDCRISSARAKFFALFARARSSMRPSIQDGASSEASSAALKEFLRVHAENIENAAETEELPNQFRATPCG